MERKSKHEDNTQVDRGSVRHGIRSRLNPRATVGWSLGFIDGSGGWRSNLRSRDWAKSRPFLHHLSGGGHHSYSGSSSGSEHLGLLVGSKEDRQ